jgi:glycosyltransferase involved in cell wall biosynthesis
MRVAFVASEYPPHVHGGLGVHVEALAAALAAQSVQVELFVPDRPGYQQPPRGVRLRPVPTVSSGIEDYSIGFWIDFCVGVLALNDRLDTTFDLVHCHDWMTALAGAGLHVRYGLPLIFNVHLPQVMHPHLELEMLGLTLATTGVVNSEQVRQEVQHRDPALPACVVVPGGVDTNRFQPPTAERVGTDPTVLFVGRLVPQKGVDILLRSFAILRRRIPNANLVIAGDGDQDLYLRRLARYFGLPPRVAFVGWQTGDALVRLYQRIEAVAVPSRYEPFGLVALEAMSCGRPVVASRSGGLAEIVEDGRTGYLVPPGDHLRLAQRLAWLLLNERVRRTLGGAARKRALRYEWRHVASATKQLYEEAIRTNPSMERLQANSAVAELMPILSSLSSLSSVTAMKILSQLRSRPRTPLGGAESTRSQPGVE